jgi:hypothetical protein
MGPPRLGKIGWGGWRSEQPSYFIPTDEDVSEYVDGEWRFKGEHFRRASGES